MQTDVRERTKRNPFGAGRDPRAEKPADTRITIRLTDDEHQRYAAAAETAGKSLAEWLRSAAEAMLSRAKKGRRS